MRISSSGMWRGTARCRSRGSSRPSGRWRRASCSTSREAAAAAPTLAALPAARPTTALAARLPLAVPLAAPAADPLAPLAAHPGRLHSLPLNARTHHHLSAAHIHRAAMRPSAASHRLARLQIRLGTEAGPPPTRRPRAWGRGLARGAAHWQKLAAADAVLSSSAAAAAAARRCHRPPRPLISLRSHRLRRTGSRRRCCPMMSET